MTWCDKDTGSFVEIEIDLLKESAMTKLFIFVGISLLSLSLLPSVLGQGRFAENLFRLRSSIPPQQFQQMLLKFTAKFFSPHDSNIRGERWSTVFLLQSNKSDEAFFQSKFNNSTEIQYSHFDFINANEDGSDIAKTFREDIAMLIEMENIFDLNMTGSDFEANPRFDLAADPMDVSKDHLELMLTKVLTFPRNHELDQELNEPVKHEIGGYIWAKLGSFGFLTGAQTFKPQHMLNPFGGDVPKGSNMIGILPGQMWGTPQDRILVVGAHWDTVRNTGGLDDNGSGVAAMLELARALHHGKCSNKFSVILVAFDLEEFGSQGSLVFVQDFLIPKVLEAGGFPQFTGAIIMDSLLHHNTSTDSQDMEKEWVDQVPVAAKSIKEKNMRGDFLAAFTRATPGDRFLTDVFENNWGKNRPDKTRPDKNIRLEKFIMTKLDKEFLSLNMMADHLNFLRSDHCRFWVANNKKYFASLPAIVLTDTGPYRGNMRNCYHSPCDTWDPEKKERINWNFYLHTVQSLIDTVVELTGAQCRSRRKFNDISTEAPEGMFMMREGDLPMSSVEEKSESEVSPDISDVVPIIEHDIQNEILHSSVSNAVFVEIDSNVSKHDNIHEIIISEEDRSLNQRLRTSLPQSSSKNTKYSLPSPFYPTIQSLPLYQPHHHHHILPSIIHPPPQSHSSKLPKTRPHWITLPSVPYPHLFPFCQPFC